MKIKNLFMFAMVAAMGAVSVSVSAQEAGSEEAGRLPIITPPAPVKRMAKPKVSYLSKFERTNNAGQTVIQYNFVLDNSKKYRKYAKLTNGCESGLVLYIYNADTNEAIYGHCDVNKKVLKHIGETGFWFARLASEAPIKNFRVVMYDYLTKKGATSDAVRTDE